MSEEEIIKRIMAALKVKFDDVPDAELVALVKGLKDPAAVAVAALVSKRMKQLRLRAMACTFASMVGGRQ